MMLDITETWEKIHKFQNPELRNSKLTTCSMPMKY